MAQDQALYLTEGLWITAKAPDHAPSSPISSGGGGPGSGGWGLSTGHPRGTSVSKSQIGNEIAWQRIFGEESVGSTQHYKNTYSPIIQALPAQIDSERAAIAQQSLITDDNQTAALTARQVTLTSTLQLKRILYLDKLPQAIGFFGAIPFFKLNDSFMTRLNDPGAFDLVGTGESWSNTIWETFNSSLDAAYQLHIEAEKIQALADDLPKLANKLDQAESQDPLLDLSKAIERRTAQIYKERQICFDCLPNTLQHELVAIVNPSGSKTLSLSLADHIVSVNSLAIAKESAVPTYTKVNPEINSPLSKPQLEALAHLVDEQSKRRAGSRWADYHRALLFTESARYLYRFASSLGGLHQRALDVEQLQVQHEVRQAAAREAEEAARRKADAERLIKEAAHKAEAEGLALEAAQKAEAERLALEAAQEAETKRLAAEEAARQQAEAERLAAETQRQQQELERQRITYSAPGSASAPLILPIGAAAFAVTELSYRTFQLAMAAAVSRLAVSVAPIVTPLLVGVMSMSWSPTLGNSERRYLISIPLADLSSSGGPDLASMVASSKFVEIPYILAGIENGDYLDLYIAPGGRPIPVRAATFDSGRQVYSLALDNPQRILTWTPSSAPGGQQGNSTILPPAPPGTIVYTGSSLNTVDTEQESYPTLDALDQERMIVTFPADSGLAPILIVFKSPRHEPGVATGKGDPVTGIWLGDSARSLGAAIPSRIAAQLVDREFRTFDDFRIAFWKAIANDEVLAKQFSAQNISAMKASGTAPFAPGQDHYMSHRKYILHHMIPISESGAVYDIDNIRVVTPKAHNSINYGEKQ